MLKEILCCDWGTSSFRLRLVATEDLQVLAATEEGSGIAQTFSAWQESGGDRFGFYSDIVRKAIQNLSEQTAKSLSNIPVIVSGMASSSIGMCEVPYAGLPFHTDGSGASVSLVNSFNGDDGHLMIISGIRSDDDVMRGEEAQLVGLFRLPELAAISSNEAIIVLPGTHSKHVVVSREHVTAFRTYMTGEIYHVISKHTILKDSISSGEVPSDANYDAFRQGVRTSAERNILNSLFTTRTNQLFGKFSKTQNSLYLSGLLIGSELNDLNTQGDTPVFICCGKQLERFYMLAAEDLLGNRNVNFIEHRLIDKATIAGQLQIFNSNI